MGWGRRPPARPGSAARCRLAPAGACCWSGKEEAPGDLCPRAAALEAGQSCLPVCASLLPGRSGPWWWKWARLEAGRTGTGAACGCAGDRCPSVLLRSPCTGRPPEPAAPAGAPPLGRAASGAWSPVEPATAVPPAASQTCWRKAAFPDKSGSCGSNRTPAGLQSISTHKGDLRPKTQHLLVYMKFLSARAVERLSICPSIKECNQRVSLKCYFCCKSKRANFETFSGTFFLFRKEFSIWANVWVGLDGNWFKMTTERVCLAAIHAVP